MKKLFTLAAVALTALSMKADLYIMGDGSDLSWTDFPGKVVKLGADGYYTAEFTSLNSFKISNTEGTNWDGFNAGAYQVASGSFGDQVYSANGQTLNLTKNSADNIETPWNGVYTLRVDQNFQTINLKTTTPKPTTAPDAFILGNMNSWSPNDAWKFDVKTEGNNYVYTLNCQISAGVTFKIGGRNATNGNADWGGAINYTTGGSVSDFTGTPLRVNYNSGSDMSLTKAFSGTITLTIPTTPKQSGTISFLEGGSFSYPDQIYVIGNINGSAFAPNVGTALSSTGEGTYSGSTTITGADGTPFGYFHFSEKLATNSTDWEGLGTRYFAPEPDCEVTLGESYTLQSSADQSFKIGAGNYTFTVDLVNSTVVVTAGGGGDDVDPNPNPNPNPNPGDVKTIYVVGNGQGMTWDLPGQAYELGEDGNFTFTITGGSQFKFSINNATAWDGDGQFDAGAYATGNTSFTNAVLNPEGETLSLQNWGQNQELPWDGDYRIVIAGDISTMTVYAITPAPEGPATVYIRGDMNDWMALETWEMSYDETDGSYFFTCSGDTKILAGQAFKFADSNWGIVNYGNGNMSIDVDAVYGVDEVLMKGGENMALASDFEGTIRLTLNDSDAVATFTSTTDGVAEVEAAAEGEAVYYNLQGVRVLNPERGVYVRVLNGKAEKVVL
ncbi:MAG: hypothetical protein J1E97_05340 [Muribaculaceae bacterium]|nr:hypothetical protein [Muribaculaceae bacterium]